MSLSKPFVGLSSILTGLVLLKVVAHYDVYSFPLMTVREMWHSLPLNLKFMLASGYLLVLFGCAMLTIAIVNRWSKKHV